MPAALYRTCPVCHGGGGGTTAVYRVASWVGDRIGRRRVFGVSLVPQPCRRCGGAGFLCAERAR
jgi:hypothetical protein